MELDSRRCCCFDVYRSGGGGAVGGDDSGCAIEYRSYGGGNSKNSLY